MVDWGSNQSERLPSSIVPARHQIVLWMGLSITSKSCFIAPTVILLLLPSITPIATDKNCFMSSWSTFIQLPALIGRNKNKDRGQLEAWTQPPMSPSYATKNFITSKLRKITEEIPRFHSESYPNVSVVPLRQIYPLNVAADFTRSSKFSFKLHLRKIKSALCKAENWYFSFQKWFLRGCDAEHR